MRSPSERVCGEFRRGNGVRSKGQEERSATDVETRSRSGQRRQQPRRNQFRFPQRPLQQLHRWSQQVAAPLWNGCGQPDGRAHQPSPANDRDAQPGSRGGLLLVPDAQSFRSTHQQRRPTLVEILVVAGHGWARASSFRRRRSMLGRDPADGRFAVERGDPESRNSCYPGGRLARSVRARGRSVRVCG